MVETNPNSIVNNDENGDDSGLFEQIYNMTILKSFFFNLIQLFRCGRARGAAKRNRTRFR